MRSLNVAYRNAHDMMRNLDGLQPQEAFDEMLKYLFFREQDEEQRPFTVLPDTTGKTYIRESAKEIRRRFRSYVEAENSFFEELWQTSDFILSDEALYLVHSHIQGFRLNDFDGDIRSAALQQFVTPEVRRGLGIYPTPDAVVKEAVGALSPELGAKVLDPACGAGTFLIHVLRNWSEQHPKSKNRLVVYGSDKNPRMLTIADLNLSHGKRTDFKRVLVDSLAPIDNTFLRENYFDYIFTNPPFGVNLDSRAIDFRKYESALDANRYPLKHQDSDVLFLERCLQLLSPGGELAIVMPRSFMTNSRLGLARAKLGEFGHVWGVLTLPSETFAATGTQTTTAVLFIRRYVKENERLHTGGIAIARALNVGFDTTGRARQNPDITGLGNEIRKAARAKKTLGRAQFVDDTIYAESFNRLADLIADRSSKSSASSRRRVGDVVTAITTGLTPSRAAYADEGLFLIKVGNLTGAGIDWMPRDRNFIDLSQFAKRERSKRSLIVQPNDIVLTSSAHAPRYIAKKADIVTSIPQWAGGRASYVGEVMLLRTDPAKLDPFRLLAFIRHPQTIERIQLMVRGQTAHLHADDIAELPLPDELFEDKSVFDKVGKLIRDEANVCERMNEIAYAQMALLSETSFR
jgi:type I restriction enzyme M protein